MRHGNPASKTQLGIMTLFFELSNSKNFCVVNKTQLISQGDLIT